MQAKGEYIPEVFYINGMKQPSASDPSHDSPCFIIKNFFHNDEY